MFAATILDQYPIHLIKGIGIQLTSYHDRMQKMKQKEKQNHMDWKKKDLLANIWESRVGLRCWQWNSRLSSVWHVRNAEILVLIRQIKIQRKYRMIENWKNTCCGTRTSQVLAMY